MNNAAVFRQIIATLSTNDLHTYQQLLTDELFHRLEKPQSPIPTEDVKEIPVGTEDTVSLEDEIPPPVDDGKASARSQADLEKESEKVAKDCMCCWGNHLTSKCTFDEYKVLTMLPRAWRPFRSYPIIMETLVRYEPEKTDQEGVTYQVDALLKVIENASGTEHKSNICRHLFRLLAANVWFLEENQRFREILRHKLVEFEADPSEKVQAVAKEFSWIKEWTAQRQCAYCGERGVWLEFDGCDYFCSTAHLQAFEMNGDSVHKPGITVQQLDQELDECLAMKRWMRENKSDCHTAMDIAAAEGNLDVLKWLHLSNETCTVWAMDLAAKNGHMEVVKFLHENRGELCSRQSQSDWQGCTTFAMNCAAGAGHLDIVKFLHENRQEGCTSRAMDWAAKNGHLDVVVWLHENRQEGCTNLAMDTAAGNGHLHVVEWLHENRTEGYTDLAIHLATKNNHPVVVEWLQAHQRTDKSDQPAYNAGTGKYQKEYEELFAELVSATRAEESEDWNLLNAATVAYKINNIDTFWEDHGSWEMLSDRDAEFLDAFDPLSPQEWDAMLDATVERILVRRQ